MRLREYIHDDLIVHGLKASERDEVLEAFSTHLQEQGFVPSGPEVFEALTAREDAHTTALGEGIAVPHATVSGLERVLILVATTEDPIPFGPQDTQPVDLFFLLLSPPGREGEHIKLLARICRLARHPGVVETLRNASDRGAFGAAVLRVDSEHV
jgi:PTS system nitrogen regulatory IIA component